MAEDRGWNDDDDLYDDVVPVVQQQQPAASNNNVCLDDVLDGGGDEQQQQLQMMYQKPPGTRNESVHILDEGDEQQQQQLQLQEMRQKPPDTHNVRVRMLEDDLSDDGVGDDNGKEVYSDEDDFRERARFNSDLHADEDELALDVVTISPEHLRGNGTIHTTPFDGIAELVDNACDCGAKNISIEKRDTANCRFLSVIDDGAGMSRSEALSTIMLGHSLKRGDSNTIGQFGNGLKSGSMRLGETMALCTKKDEEVTVLMISLPYMESAKDSKCYVPCVSYQLDADSGQLLAPIDPDDEASWNKHRASLARILRYSPFDQEPMLHAFIKEKLSGPSGTCVVVRNLRKTEDKRDEIQLHHGDLVVPNRDEEESRKYLSDFLQTLYIDPKVVIHIQGRQVRLLDVRRAYACPRWAWLDLDLFRAKERLLLADEHRKLKMKRACAQAAVQQQHNAITGAHSVQSRQAHAELRRARMVVEKLDAQLDDLTAKMNDKSSTSASIRVHFGLDVERRAEPRVIYYSNGRRILVAALPTKSRDGSAFKAVMGVVVMVDIPSTLLPTKQSRENFELPSELAVIARKLHAHAKTYLARIDAQFKRPAFWAQFGYTDARIDTDVPTPFVDGVRERLFAIMGSRRQCASCRLFWSLAEFDDSCGHTLEKSTYQCMNGCKPKTAEELKKEEIKKLDERSKATYYDDEDPVAARKKKKQEEEMKRKREEEKRKAAVKPSNKQQQQKKKRRTGRAMSEESSVSYGSYARSEMSRSPTPPPRNRNSFVREPPVRDAKGAGGGGGKRRSARIATISQGSGTKKASVHAMINSSDEEEEADEREDRAELGFSDIDEGQPSAHVAVKKEVDAPPLFTNYPSKRRVAEAELAELKQEGSFDDDVLSCDDATTHSSMSRNQTGDRGEMAAGRTGRAASLASFTIPKVGASASGELKRRSENGGGGGKIADEPCAKQKKGEDRRTPDSSSTARRDQRESTIDRIFSGAYFEDHPHDDVAGVPMAVDVGGAVVGGPPVDRLETRSAREADLGAKSDQERTECLLDLQEKFYDARQANEKKDEEIAALRAQLDEARKQQPASQSRTEDAEQIMALNEELSKLTLQSEEYLKNWGDTAADLKQANQQLEAARKDCSAQFAQIVQKEGEIVNLKRGLASAKRENAQKDEYISTLEAGNDQKNNRITEMDDQLVAANKKIEEMELQQQREAAVAADVVIGAAGKQYASVQPVKQEPFLEERLEALVGPRPLFPQQPTPAGASWSLGPDGAARVRRSGFDRDAADMSRDAANSSRDATDTTRSTAAAEDSGWAEQSSMQSSTMPSSSHGIALITLD